MHFSFSGSRSLFGHGQEAEGGVDDRLKNETSYNSSREPFDFVPLDKEISSERFLDVDMYFMYTAKLNYFL